jgi:hypothetical protein
MKIPENVLSWLIENNNPAVRYRTLTELLDYAQDHSKVIETQKKIIDSQPVTKIFSQIGRNGEWPWSGSYDSPELGIGYLGELGLDHTNPIIDKAIQAFLSQQYPDGSFPNSYSIRKDPENARRNDESCYYALTLRGLIRLGYQDDERVKKALSFVLSEARWDGGYLCTKSYVKDSTKSCIRGSKNVLLLFAELPDLWETDECQKLVEYFLDRKVFFKRNDHTQFARGDPFIVYPFHYRFGILEPVYALSKMGYGKHPSLSEAWEFLEEKKDETGKFKLDWSMPRCAFNPGKKGSANKWVTLYAYLSKKQQEN